MSLLIARLRKLKTELKSIEHEKSKNYYQVNSTNVDDSYLKGPKMIPNNTYSEIDIYSASSGFVSDDCGSKHETEHHEHQDMLQPYYESAESVRLKKYQLKELFIKNQASSDHDMTYERAMQSIDETMKMLKESAEKL